MLLSAAVRFLKRNPWRSLMSILTLGVGLAAVSIGFAAWPVSNPLP